MPSRTIQAALVALALLLAAPQPAAAVDILFYYTDNCSGTIQWICPNQDEGWCCGDWNFVYDSVQSSPGRVTHATASRGKRSPCQFQLGIGRPCFGGIGIQGAWWTSSKKRDGVEEKPVSDECTKPSLVRYEEDGITYTLFTNSTKYAELTDLVGAARGEGVMGKFIKENSDLIVPV